MSRMMSLRGRRIVALTLILVLGACGLGGSAKTDFDGEVKPETRHGLLDESTLFHGQQDDEPISTEKLTSYQKIYVNNVMVLLNEIEDTYEEEAYTGDKGEIDESAENNSEDATVHDEPELLSVNGYDTKEKSDRISVHRLDQLQYECDIPNDMLESVEFKWKLNGVVIDEKEPAFSPSISDYPSIERADLNVSCIFKLNRIEKPIELKFPLVRLDSYKFQNWRPTIYFFKRKYKRSIGVIKVLLATFAAVGIVSFIGFTLFKQYQAKKRTGQEKEENSQPFLKI